MRRHQPKILLLALVIGLSACGGGGGAAPTVEVLGVEPASGGVAGGTRVTIEGVRLGEAFRVDFGGQPAVDVVVVDDETLTCTTPAGVLGPVPVLVESAQGVGSLEDGYTYNPAPLLLSATPAIGPLVGGQQVTLTGLGFVDGDPGETRVSVGGRPAAGVTVVSDTTLRFLVPAGVAAGAVDIEVRNRNGTAVLSTYYVYTVPPTLTLVQADSGPAGGGRTVTLTGTGFDTPGLRVTFGAVDAERTIVTSATTIDCRTPPGSAGATDVTVETVGGSDTLPSAYTYTTWAPNDDYYSPDQWHLYNDGTYSNTTSGEDANVVPVWDLGYTGAGIRIAILDDGLEIAHEDLAANMVPNGSWDYANDDNDPTMGQHGTSVAGVAAAVGGNALGVTGAAPNAALAGLNILQDQTSANFGDAFARDAAETGVSNSSWGVWPISNSTFWGFNSTFSSMQVAIATGLTTGRGGKGTVYVKSAGNHYPYVANFDGANNLRGMMCIGAVTSHGVASYYSQPGCNVIVCTHSNGAAGIRTTDRTGSTGYSSSNYTGGFGGTSSACPLAAGCIALILEANPELRWWEVPVLLARSARQVDATHADWVQNGAGLWVNHRYGFGLLDTSAAVTMARSWTPLPSLVSSTASTSVGQTVSAGGAAVTSTITIPSSTSVAATHTVTATLLINHQRASDLEIVLTSPDGTESVYCPSQTYSGTTAANSANNLPLLSFRHMDEDPVGTWTMSVRDGVGTYSSTWTSWSLTVEGASSSTSAAPLQQPTVATKPPLPAAPIARDDEAVWFNGRRWERARRDDSVVEAFGSDAVVYRDGADGRGRLRALTGRLLVQWSPRLGARDVADLEARFGLVRQRELSMGRNWFLYGVRGAKTASLRVVSALLELDEVFHAAPDWQVVRHRH